MCVCVRLCVVAVPAKGGHDRHVDFVGELVPHAGALEEAVVSLLRSALLKLMVMGLLFQFLYSRCCSKIP